MVVLCHYVYTPFGWPQCELSNEHWDVPIAFGLRKLQVRKMSIDDHNKHILLHDFKLSQRLRYEKNGQRRILLCGNPGHAKVPLDLNYRSTWCCGSEGGETHPEWFPCHRKPSVYQKLEKLWPAVVSRRRSVLVANPR